MFKLGIIIKDDNPIAHRSLLKLFLNPILRVLFNRALGSEIKDLKFIRYQWIKQKPNKPHFSFKVNFDYDKIV